MSIIDNRAVAEALARAAQEMNSTNDVDSTLDAIVRTAAQSLPGVDHVGITIAYRSGELETRAGTDPLVWELDSVQYALSEGPCIHSLDVEPIVVINHLAEEQRWPNYVPQATRLGVKSQMGLRLYFQDDTIGGLNLYSTESEVIEPQVAHAAELFATHAALALGKARREDQMSETLATHKVISQAIGLVMERYQIDEQRAFQFLVRVATGSDLKVRAIAQDLLDEANSKYAQGLDPAPGETQPDEESASRLI